MTKDEAKQKIAELVEKYQKLSVKDIKGFNEAATKQGFIEPMFRALGWGFENTDEVSPEENASNGRVDYAFKINNVSQFYVEAKSLKEDVNDPKHIKQAVSYAYSQGVTWAVLTNFHSLRVFNAQKTEPFIPLESGQYDSSFERLWLLSKESIELGLLTKEAISWGALPFLIPIEKRLFVKLREWRELLFNQISRYNDEMHLENRQVDEIIQKLFNRLIFIRTAEDRGIEEKGLLALLHQWKSSGKKGKLFDILRQLFHEYEGYYDSDLFQKHLLDDPQIFIENEVTEDILGGLYEISGSMASYNFNDIDADVLGAVYEQYLGHVAEVTKQRAREAQIKMELGGNTETYTINDKKERRKEHGIYYTPKYITDYIVKETVGKFLKENSGYPDKLRNLKILDPACGSGSFLIRAYDELLKYHADEIKIPVHQLDQLERLPILTNNIYGVDLDKQAVEVARLNLLLRSLAKREPLPYLGNNIKNGNSLISGTEEKLKEYFGDNWKDKNAFNWDNEFKDIINNGGFDIVIGNPPYIEFKRLENDIKSILENDFLSARGKYDIYIPFIEKSIKLLKPNGYLGFICPTMFLKRDYGKSLRSFLKDNSILRDFVDFADNQIFGEATNYTGIFIFQKSLSAITPCLCKVFNSNLNLSGVQMEQLLIDGSSNKKQIKIFNIDTSRFGENSWNLTPTTRFNLCDRILKTNPSILKDVCDQIWEGIASGKDEVFYLDEEKIKTYQIEPSLLHPLLRGKDVFKWRHVSTPSIHVLYPYNVATNSPISEDDLKTSFPHAYQYLLYNREQLKGRPYFDASEKLWYELWCERKPSSFTKTKIITPEISKNNSFSLETEGFFFNTKVYGIIKRTDIDEDNKYILALLNSGLLQYYYQSNAPPKAGGFYAYKTMFLRNLPIHRINFENQSEKTKHNSLVALANKMLDLNFKLHAVTEYEIEKKHELEKEAKTTGGIIDNLVYELYGLTEEEKMIVESSIVNN